MLPFRKFDQKSRRVIFLVTLVYMMIVGLLIVMARAASAETASPPNPSTATVDIRALDSGGLFLATEDPTRLLPAPLQSTDVDISVSGSIARVTVRQTFTNPTSLWLEAIYTFPLPDKSAVDRLEMLIGERRIKGIIQEKEKARQTYQKARSEGRRASLVSQERPNIFTTELANIGPGETITIEIAYQENLRYDQGTFRLTFPMVVRPRFSPGQSIVHIASTGRGWAFDTTSVPDASRITPPIADPAFGPLNPVRIHVRLDPGFPVEKITSAYHLIDISKGKGGIYDISLAVGEVPAASDFTLQWRPAKGAEPTAGMFTEIRGGDAYHILMIMPPALEKTSNGPVHRRETVFILDVSGSMAGDAIREAKAALRLALDRLKPDDSFNIIAFSSSATSLFSMAQPANAVNLRGAQIFVDRLVADGGTNMASALNLALTGGIDMAYLRQIVFITDGAVGNEEQLFQMIRQGLGDSRLFTVGISSSPNSFFMTEAAEAGHGTYTFIGRPDEVATKMLGLFRKLERPVLTDIDIVWPSGVKAEIYPRTLPDLYDGEPVVLAFRVPESTGGDIIVRGKVPGQTWQRTIPLDADKVSPGVSAIWARSKILDITRQARHAGTSGHTETRQAIIDVALAHQLLSQYTSLVAVDDVVARPKDQLLASAAVPTNLPDGMDPAFASLKSASGILNVPAMLKIDRRALAGGSGAPLPAGATMASIRILSGMLILLLALLALLFIRRQSLRDQ